ncbi:hypothetical protein ACVPOR_02680 [Staphylococcus aureus]
MKLVEFGKYNEDLANASKDMEVYFRSWAGGTDPDPSNHMTAIDLKMK